MSFKLITIIVLLMIGNTFKQFSANRQLLIFGKEGNETLVQQQLQVLNAEPDALKERAIKITVVEKDNALHKKYSAETGQFAVILIGKDGTEKYRTNTLLQTKELFAVIDAMPMRRAEMKRKGEKSN